MALDLVSTAWECRSNDSLVSRAALCLACDFAIAEIAAAGRQKLLLNGIQIASQMLAQALPHTAS